MSTVSSLDRYINREWGTEIKKMRKNRILIVDDEDDINLLFKMVLEDNGYKVDTFNDPLVALRNFRAGSYDLLLLLIATK